VQSDPVFELIAIATRGFLYLWFCPHGRFYSHKRMRAASVLVIVTMLRRISHRSGLSTHLLGRFVVP
jgi:hypothetical protein